MTLLIVSSSLCLYTSCDDVVQTTGWCDLEAPEEGVASSPHCGLLFAARSLTMDGFTFCSHEALLEAFCDVVVYPNQTGLGRYPDIVLRNPVVVSRSFHAAGRELTELTTDLSAELRDCYGCLPWL